MRPMELIDALKLREDTILMLGELQEQRLVVLTKLLVEVHNATPIGNDGFTLSNEGISLLQLFEQLITAIDKGFNLLCTINKKTGFPAPSHLKKPFRKLIKEDKEFIAKLGVRPA